MPQEYSTRTPGSPAPSPSSFGSEPMRLDQPNFVAQTNVGKAPDVFGALQEILGLGVKVGIQATEMRTQAIKDNISIERAKEATTERLDANERRKKMDARTAAMAKRDLAIQLEKDPIKQAALLSSFEVEAASFIASGDSESAIDTLQAAQKSEVATSQIKITQQALSNAAAVKLIQDSSKPINTYTRSGDELALTGMLLTAQDKAADESLPGDVRSAHIQIANNVAHALQALDQDTARTAAIAKEQERALQQETRTAVLDAGQSHILSMMANTYRMSVDLIGVSTENVRKALFDDMVERISTSNPAMADLLASADTVEGKAASEALYNLVESVAVGISRERNAVAERVRVNVITDAALSIASQGTADASANAVQYIENESLYMTPVQVERAYKNIGKAAIDSNVERNPTTAGPSVVASLYPILLDNTLPVGVRVAALDTAKSHIAKIGSGWEVRRNLKQEEDIPAEVDLMGNVTKAAIPGANYGYANMANTPEEFLSKFTLESYGLTPEAIAADENLSTILQTQMSTMYKAYIADASRRDAVRNSLRIANARATKEGRLKLSVNDAFSESALGRAIEDGTYTSMSSSTVASALTDALVGYRDEVLPTVLKDIITDGSGDLHNHRLINEFWKIHKPGENGRLDTLLLTSPGMRISRADGLFMAHLESMPDIGEQKRTDILKSFHNNVVAQMGGIQMPSAPGSEALKTQIDMDAYVTQLSSGVGLEVGMFVPDPWNYSATEAYATMDEADKVTVLSIAQMASAAPSEYRDGLMTTMLQKQGYGMYQMASGDYNLLNTSRGRSRSVDSNGRPIPGTTGLPSSAVVGSYRYDKFLQSLIPEINTALAQRKDINGNTLDAFTQSDHHSVGISPTDFDLRDGVCGLFVLNAANQRVEVDLSEAFITTDKWVAWQRANPAHHGEPSPSTSRPELVP